MKSIFWKEIFHGKSLGRARLNARIAELSSGWKGEWLDIGAGPGTGPGASYLPYLPSSMKRIATDMYGAGATQTLDANQPFPLVSESFDGVLSTNMLYITEDPLATLKECLRVTKSGGTFVGTFPFFFPEHPQPHDYWRWTREGVERLLTTAGWSEIVVEPIGKSWTAFGSSLLIGRGSMLVRLIFAPLVLLGDYWSKSDVTFLWLAQAKKK